MSNQDSNSLPRSRPQVAPGSQSSNQSSQNPGSKPITQGSRPAQKSSASSYAHLQYLFGSQDLAMINPKGAKNRRKSTQGPDHIKHRRTRSGCYTCRARRVKCDEKHPICERCRKGGRDCVFPPEVMASKNANSSGSRAPATKTTPEEDSSEEEEDDESSRLESIPDEDEGELPAAELRQRSRQLQRPSKQNLRSQKSFTRPSSETPSLIQDKGLSPTPSTEGSIGYAAYASISGVGATGWQADWSTLPQDVQFYIQFFHENVTYHHYVLKHDHTNFIHTTMIDLAFRDEALLYAVVGFSAFQWTLHNPEGRIQDFLQYYNKAVSLLLRNLRRRAPPTITTLLTILQLATIEEYLGDWVNLFGHQKAAFEILQELFTPQTVVQHETTRMVLSWYTRFDVYASLVGGYATVLSREWFSSNLEFCQQRLAEDPSSIPLKIEEAYATLRLVALDMSLLFAKVGKKLISHEEFLRENNAIAVRIMNWKDGMDPALRDPRYQVSDFSRCPPRDPESIVDPYVRGILYQGPLYGMNNANIDWYAIYLMHQHSTSEALKVAPSKALLKEALECCQLFEAIHFWPGSLNGSTLAVQQVLGIAAIFLPPEEQFRMWCRRKLAFVEANGFIYPKSFRAKMSALFQDPSCMHWWLPNEEMLTPIVKSIQAFAAERTSQAKDNEGEGLRDMRAILASLDLEDKDVSSPESDFKGKQSMAAPSSRQWGTSQTTPSVNMSHDLAGNDYDYDHAGQAYWTEGTED